MNTGLQRAESNKSLLSQDVHRSIPSRNILKLATDIYYGEISKPLRSRSYHVGSKITSANKKK